MLVTIRHETVYTYEPAAPRMALRLRLYPSTFASQSVLHWIVRVNGQEAPPLIRNASGDEEGLWTRQAPTDRIEIVAEGQVRCADAAGVVRGFREFIRPQVYLRETALSAPDAAIRALAVENGPDEPLARMHALSERVARRIVYTAGRTGSGTTAAEAIALGQGVCQDHAHVFISAARLLGAPARYVVGYLRSDGEGLAETHAWAEVFIHDLGWVGFDVANQICPTDRYVRLGAGLDAYDAAPIRGSVGGAPVESLRTHVDIGVDQ